MTLSLNSAAGRQPVILKPNGVATIGNGSAVGPIADVAAQQVTLAAQQQATATQLAQAAASITSSQSAAPFLKLLSDIYNGQPTSIVIIGDDECANVANRSLTWPDQLTSTLRTKALAGAGDKGTGYVGAGNWWAGSGAYGAGTSVTGGYGLDGRAIKLSSGQSATFSAAQLAYVNIMWTAGASNGAADVYIDGTKVGSIDGTWPSGSTGVASSSQQSSTFSATSAGSHTVKVTCTSGVFQLEGALCTTAMSGLTTWTALRSNTKVADWDYSAWTSALSYANADLVIIAIGKADMAASTNASSFAQSLGNVIYRIQTAAPTAGILVVIEPPRIEDIQSGAGPSKQAALASQAVQIATGYQNVSVMSEGNLFQPASSTSSDLTAYDPAGYTTIASAKNSFTRSAFGNTQLAGWLANQILYTHVA